MSKAKYAIGITLFESKKFGGPKICEGAICPTERANKICCGVIEVMKMADVKIIGQMDNTIDHTFESANRVYDIGGVAPTMNTCGDGGLQPKIIETKCVGGLGEKSQTMEHNIISRKEFIRWENVPYVYRQTYPVEVITILLTRKFVMQCVEEIQQNHLTVHPELSWNRHLN